MKHILRCPTCMKFTMQEKCCDVRTEQTKPAKYSPDDKYKDLKRQAKQSNYEERGLI